MLRKVILRLFSPLVKPEKKQQDIQPESWLTLQITISFYTSFQVKYRSLDGFNKIREFLGQEAKLPTLPCRDIAVFVNNNTLKNNQTIHISLYNGEQLIKSREYVIPSDCHFTPWLSLDD
jgi:hypothetical protein